MPALQIIALVLAIRAAALVSPSRFRWIIPIVIVPLAYVIGPAGLSYYAVFPIRVVLPVVLLSVIVEIRVRNIGRPTR